MCLITLLSYSQADGRDTNPEREHRKSRGHHTPYTPTSLQPSTGLFCLCFVCELLQLTACVDSPCCSRERRRDSPLQYRN